MSTALDWIDGGGDGFAFGEAFVRQRAGIIEDPYSGEPIGEDWASPDEEALDGAYFSSQGSTDSDGDVRRQTTTGKQLIVPDPDADVRRGDRIRQGTRVWSIVGFPENDTNPFTGWQPTLVVDVEDFTG